MSELSHKLEGSTLVLSGAITEAAELPTDLPSPLTIDLSGVARINSLGVKRWVDFLDSLDRDQVTLVRCSPVMVRQFNMVPTTTVARVASVKVPWYCEACDEERETEVELAGAPPELGEPPCPECGEPLELDEVLEAYFGFLSG